MSCSVVAIYFMNYFLHLSKHGWRSLIFQLMLMSAACSISARPAYAADPEWFPFSVNEDQLSAVTDFSAMNNPLTPSDRLFVKQAHFYRIGADNKINTADDQRVRLFGISLSGAANFPPEEDAPKIARRLRRLGFNAVRLHHLDSVLSDSDAQPQGILNSGAFPSFNPVALQRLHTLIEALRQEGIYVNLNLHVGYTFRYAVDRLTPMLPGETMPHASHPLHVFEPRMIALQVEYAQQLIRRLQLNDDPALAMIEINNESSLAGAWQRKELDGLSGEYERLLQQQWQHWITRQHGSLKKACGLWRSCGLTKQGALLVKSDEAHVLAHGEGWFARARYFLQRVATKLGWSSSAFFQQEYEMHEQGAGRRVLDFTRFLVEMDKQYLDTMRKAIRAEVGPNLPLTGTQVYFGGLLNTDAQQEMDYVDEHFYVDHYDFPHQAWDRNDWRIRDHSALREGWEPLLKRAFYRDARKPFVVSEFNQAYPNRQSAEIIPVMTAIASAQDWDGLFFFHYVDGNSWQALPDSFGLSGQSGQLATVGMSAAMFRYFQIPVLREQLRIPISAEQRQLFGALGDGVSSTAYTDYLKSKRNIDIKDAFSKHITVSDAPYNNEQALQSKEERQASSTDNSAVWSAAGGAMQFHPDGPNLRVTTPYSGLFAGFGASTDKQVAEQWMSPVFAKNTRQFGVMLAMSRDGKPLSTSRRVLLSLSGATMGSQPDEIPTRPKKLVPYAGDHQWWTLEPDSRNAGKPSGPRDAIGPVWQERVAATIFYPTKAHKIQIYPLDGQGQRLSAIAASDISRVAGGFQITLNKPTVWYEVLIEGR